MDPASIEVNRRARQAKTDRLDADKLLAMLIRHHAGERVWSVLHEPSREDEDARREHRELQRLPPRVDYTLTPLGRSLADAIVPLCTWGTANAAEMASIFAKRDALPEQMPNR